MFKKKGPEGPVQSKKEAFEWTPKVFNYLQILFEWKRRSEFKKKGPEGPVQSKKEAFEWTPKASNYLQTLSLIDHYNAIFPKAFYKESLGEIIIIHLPKGFLII